jgi:hypothetical protein
VLEQRDKGSCLPDSNSVSCASTFILRVEAIGNRLEIDIPLGCNQREESERV